MWEAVHFATLSNQQFAVYLRFQAEVGERLLLREQKRQQFVLQEVMQLLTSASIPCVHLRFQAQMDKRRRLRERKQQQAALAVSDAAVGACIDFLHTSAFSGGDGGAG